jgi:outer membrane lipoprotein-sorting protein
LRTVRVASSIVLALLVAAAVIAAPSRPKASDVLDRIQKNYSSINDYRVDVSVSMKSRDVHIPKSDAIIYYKKPNKVKVAAKEGFTLLPKTFTGNPVTEIKKNFTATYEGAAKVGKEPVHVLKLKPKTTQAGGTMKLYVEKRRGLILKTLTEFSDTKMISNWSYSKVDGKYWLPSRIKIDMAGMSSGPKPDHPRGRTMPPAVGNGTAEVKFSNYRINKGIPDKVFIEKKGSVK